MLEKVKVFVVGGVVGNSLVVVSLLEELFFAGVLVVSAGVELV